MHLNSFLVCALAAAFVSAHPGEDPAIELAEREAALSQFARRDLSHCAEKIKARGLEKRSVARRNALVNKLQKRNNLQNRDLTDLLGKSHLSPHKYTLDTPMDTIFASNASCVLSPEVTEGPYYVAGEYIRDNIVEKEPGVDLALDLQVLDVETCDPVANKYLEIWHCNSTGVYGGVAAAGNGNGDPSNLNATWLRGVLKTDEDGVAQFHTLFPGHYQGRATHIHIMVHQNATAFPNGTLFGTQAAHVGQIYFDQSLITEVEKLPAYATNKQPLTTNAQDFLLAQGAAGNNDPFVNYVLLGNKVEDGLLGWIAFGVNTTLKRTITPGAHYYETGGKQGSGGGFGGFPGGPPPGGFPVPTGRPGGRP